MIGSFKKCTALSLLIPAVLLCAPLTLLAMDKEAPQKKQGPLRPVRQTAASAAREAASAKRAGRAPASAAASSGKSRTPASPAGKGREAITASRELTVHELQQSLEEKERDVAQARQKLAAATQKDTSSMQEKDKAFNKSVAQEFCEKAKAAALTAAGNTKVPFNKDTYFSLMGKLEGISSAFTSRLSSLSEMEHYGVSTDDFFLKKASDVDTRDCYSALEYIIEIDGMFKSLNITPEIVAWLNALTHLERYQGEKYNYLLYPHVNYVVRGIFKEFKERQRSIPSALLR